MSLKRVFQMDADFEERMFAKQIAVMKGQAWNVVEALKSPDHGPLELTRRTKVCVWDELVDVPVAVPMRAGTSSEIRRSVEQQQQRLSMDEEADIASSAPVDRVKVDDLLGLTSPPADMPHPGRFEISNPMDDLPESPDEDISSLSRPDISVKRLHASYQGPARVGLSNTYDPPRQHPQQKEQDQQQRAQQRRASFATAAARRNSNSIAQRLAYDFDDDGDLEGDLGYTAAQGHMGHQRKVIVERLEAVKSRNPVFTWC
jgi:hypothetical protein